MINFFFLKWLTLFQQENDYLSKTFEDYTHISNRNTGHPTAQWTKKLLPNESSRELNHTEMLKVCNWGQDFHKLELQPWSSGVIHLYWDTLQFLKKNFTFLNKYLFMNQKSATFEKSCKDSAFLQDRHIDEAKNTPQKKRGTVVLFVRLVFGDAFMTNKFPCSLFIC